MRAFLLCLFLAASAQGATFHELLEGYDYEAAVRAFPEIDAPSPRDRALYAGALWTLQRQDEAEAAAAALMREHPDDPWSWYARASRARYEADVDAMDVATQKMVALARGNPDLRMVAQRIEVLTDRQKFKEAEQLLDAQKPSVEVQVMRAVLGLEQDPEPAMAELKSLAINAPENLRVQYRAASMLAALRRQAEAFPLAQRAAESTPALAFHRLYWRVIPFAPGLTEAQRNELFEKDVAALMKIRGDWPELWLAIAQAHEAAGRYEQAEEWRNRVLRDAAGTAVASATLYDRHVSFLRRNDGPMREDPKTRAEIVKQLRELIGYSGTSATRRRDLSLRLFFNLRDDPNASADELLALLEAAGDRLLRDGMGAAYAAAAFADRNAHLERAESLARTAVEEARAYAKRPDSDARSADFRMATARDALGWVLLRRGDMVSARTQLFAAREIYPAIPNVHYHLGQWYEVSGRLDLAAKSYERGAALQSPTLNPNPKALAALYEKRHGSSKGFDEYAERTRASAAESRRNKALATRDPNPRPAPPFQLRDLSGTVTSLESLRGKVVVVNFWGIWCGWCVRELPELQELAKKYRRDPRVVILTINNDGEPEKVRRWMQTRNYAFPVLLDDGFVRQEHISAFPTTWFIDSRGRLAFTKEGWTEHLAEEFSWRIDALRE